MSVKEILTGINEEDQRVPQAILKCLPQIESLVNLVYTKLGSGGRLFYIGAGTSGRLGIVDASECPPTYGIDHGIVIGLIAGGDAAIRKAVEFAEDNTRQAWKDLEKYKCNPSDMVIGIAASGGTPYVLGGLSEAKSKGIATGCIVCNPDSPIAAVVDAAVEVVVGPEFVTGSTRMKAGTAQKLVLNMLTTAVMIKLGKVKGNKMINMQLSNNKLVNRGTKMLMDELGLDKQAANKLLLEAGSVKKAMEKFKP